MNEAQLGGRGRCCRNPVVSRAALDQLAKWVRERTELRAMIEVKAVVSKLSDHLVELRREDGGNLRLFLPECTSMRFDTGGAGGLMGEIVVKNDDGEVLIYGPTLRARWINSPVQPVT